MWSSAQTPNQVLSCAPMEQLHSYTSFQWCSLRVSQDASVKAFHVDPSCPEASLTPFPPFPSPANPTPTLTPAHSTGPGALPSAAAGGGDAGDGVPAREPDFSTPLAGGHVGPVNALVAVRRGASIVSGAGDAMIRVWSTADLSLQRTLRGHRGSVLCLLAVGSLLVSGARDNTIRWVLPDWFCPLGTVAMMDVGFRHAGP